MKAFSLLPIAAVLTLASGCSNIERSRSLANPATPAKTIAQQVCSNCHGMHGVAINPNFPNLAAQQPVYLTAQLKEFRGHNRLDPAGFEYMWGLSRSLTDAQIKGLADYYAAQTPVSPGLIGNQTLVEEGRTVFTKGVPEKKIPACTTCHGPKGEGNAQFPAWPTSTPTISPSS